MTNRQVNKLAMYFVVLAVADKFAAVFGTIPAAVRLITKLKGIVAEIKSRSGEVDQGTSGETNAKGKAEDEMSEAVSILVGSLHAFAVDAKDEELMQKSDVVDSDIDRKRDAEKGKYCTSLVDIVEEHKAGLVEWGVTDEGIAEARSLIKAYEDSLGKAGSAKSGQTGGRQSITALFRSADLLLNMQLDKTVAQLKNTELSREYDAARVIKDVAATRKGGGSSSPDAGGASPGQGA